MLAYIQEIKKDGAANVLIKLFKNGEEIFAEEHSAPVEMERFCASCGKEIFNKEILKIRVENFLPTEGDGLVLVNFTSECICMKKKYKRIYLRGGNFVVFLRAH